MNFADKMNQIRNASEMSQQWTEEKYNTPGRLARVAEANRICDALNSMFSDDDNIAIKEFFGKDMRFEVVMGQGPNSFSDTVVTDREPYVKNIFGSLENPDDPASFKKEFFLDGKTDAMKSVFAHDKPLIFMSLFPYVYGDVVTPTSTSIASQQEDKFKVINGENRWVGSCNSLDIKTATNEEIVKKVQKAILYHVASNTLSVEELRKMREQDLEKTISDILKSSDQDTVKPNPMNTYF